MSQCYNVNTIIKIKTYYVTYCICICKTSCHVTEINGQRAKKCKAM